MIKLTDKQAEEFYHRSYKAVDGLWFMKIEDKYGFDMALQIDEQVWKILPKIQARMLKTMGGFIGGVEPLLECFTTKLSLEGFAFSVERDDKGRGFTIVVEKCPWYELMVKSNREELAGRVGDAICSAEYQIWADEFGDDIKFEIGEQLCKGSKSCVLKFSC